MVKPIKQFIGLDVKPLCFFAQILVYHFSVCGMNARCIENNGFVVRDTVSEKPKSFQVVEKDG